MLETKDALPSLTKEDLVQIIQDSCNEGFEDGQRSMTPITAYSICSNVPANPYKVTTTLFTENNTEDTGRPLTGRLIK